MWLKTRLQKPNGETSLGLPFRTKKEMNQWIKDSKDEIIEIIRYSNNELDIKLTNGNTLKVRRD